MTELGVISIQVGFSALLSLLPCHVFGQRRRWKGGIFSLCSLIQVSPKPAGDSSAASMVRRCLYVNLFHSFIHLLNEPFRAAAETGQGVSESRNKQVGSPDSLCPAPSLSTAFVGAFFTKKFCHTKRLQNLMISRE